MIPFPSGMLFRSESESSVGFLHIFSFESENLDIGVSSASIKHVVCALGSEIFDQLDDTLFYCCLKSVWEVCRKCRGGGRYKKAARHSLLPLSYLVLFRFIRNWSKHILVMTTFKKFSIVGCGNLGSKILDELVQKKKEGIIDSLTVISRSVSHIEILEWSGHFFYWH